jgi:UDP-N-acetylglucosamine 2-epimerase (non-hydrolysing)
MKLLIVVGTRPNFIKVTQFKKAAKTIENGKIDVRIVHTGQHYDKNMAQVFFKQFELIPDYFLEIPAGSPNTQMAEVMIRLEKVIGEYEPHMLMVVGDVNSTFAAALTANKIGLPISHLESGLRSRDRGMPEEINRILTDEITDQYFVTEQSGLENLVKEGKDESSVHFVGNTMIDTMVAFENQIQFSSILEDLSLQEGEFALMTMHRPATVDVKDELLKLMKVIDHITGKRVLVFPVHPRTAKRLKEFGLYDRLTNNPNVVIGEPMDYFSFQKLIAGSKFVITDSGGIQEETTFRQVPCLTLRPNTERPSTIEIGSNTLAPFEIDTLEKLIDDIESDTYKKGKIPPLWDGKSTERIVDVLTRL